MAELIHAKFLSWQHLPLLEDPFFAKRDIEDVVNRYELRSMSSNRGISNFQLWYNRVSMPTGDLTSYTIRSVALGDSYYVHKHYDKPIRPLLYWQTQDDGQSSDAFWGINGSWQVHDYVQPALRNRLKQLISKLQAPKPVVVRQVANGQTAASTDTSRDTIEKHMFVLDVQAAQDSTLPEKASITLVAFNTSQDTRPVQQANDVIWDKESRIFRAKPGDAFEVYAINERMKVVKQDLLDNKNLSASVANNLITALQETSTYHRPDGTIVHEMKYEITNRYLEIELLDEDDEPEAFAEYQVFDAQDELYAEGELDEQGYARIEGIDQEEARVHFPEFDQPAVTAI